MSEYPPYLSVSFEVTGDATKGFIIAVMRHVTERALHLFHDLGGGEDFIHPKSPKIKKHSLVKESSEEEDGITVTIKVFPSDAEKYYRVINLTQEVINSDEYCAELLQEIDQIFNNEE